MTFDPHKPFTTRSGLPARLLATDLKHDDFPIAAGVMDNFGREDVQTFTVNGRFYGDDENNPSDLDLVNIPEEHELWLNVYEDRPARNHQSRRTADDLAEESRIACVHVRYKVGEGL